MTSILDQIAQELGVSKKTVSRVLGGKRSPVYHKATERSRQILEIARRLKYRPNAAAKAVVTGKFHCVTLLLSPLREEYSVIMPGLLDGMYDGLAEQNYHLMMARVEETEIQMQAPHSLPKALRENMSDGFLINYFGKTPDRLIELIKSYDIPLICVNLKNDADCVYPDDIGGARQATEHFIRLGHRGIAYARCQQHDHYSNRDRRQGYLEAVGAAGIMPQVFEAESLPPNGGMEAHLTDLFKRPDRPTAVVCYDSDTSAVILAAAGRAALQIPRDISLLQFAAYKKFADWQVGTMLLPWQQVGTTAVRELLAKIEDPRRTFPPVTIMPELQEWNTVARPPEAFSPQ